MTDIQIGRSPGSSNSRAWWALAALALAGLTIGLDTTVLNIALPQLSTSLRASTGQLQWFSTAYTLVVGVAMLPASNLGDRFGRKRVLVASLVLFAGASAWCAWSTSPAELIAARAVLGLAGAGIMPLGFAMLPTLFPVATDKARAVTLWALASALGLPLGPIVGGWLLEHFWWGSVFALNVPLALVGVVVLVVLLPEARSASPVSIDIPGTILSSGGLAGVTYGLIDAGRSGWGAASTWFPIVIGAALLGVFWAWEHRSDHPLVQLSLFRNGSFVWGTVHATLANFALFGLLFAVPQFFQSVNGTTSLGSGLRLLPMIGGFVVGSQLGGRFSAKFGLRGVIGVGFTLSAAALGAASTTHVDTSYGFAAAWIAVLGLGLGLVLPAAMGGALGALAAERAGAGSGLLQALRQVGGTVGVAILGTVLSSGYRSHLHTDHLAPRLADTAHDSVAAGVHVAGLLHDPSLAAAARTAFVHGMDVALIVSCALAAAGALLGAAFLPGRRTVAKPAPEVVTQPREMDAAAR